MKFYEYIEKLEAIKYMAEHHRTGSPLQLAEKLNVSERTVERMVQQLREHRHPIRFNRFRNSYVINDVEEENFRRK
jgi:predicted DNA-binding transcriptional regulator YafY